MTSFDGPFNPQTPKNPAQATRGACETAEQSLELFENANDIVYTHDLNGNFTWINCTVQQITGYSREEALGMNVADLLSPESLELARRMMLKQLGGGLRSTYEVTIRTKNGRHAIVEVSSRLVFEAGRPSGVVGIARDVSERKRSEAHLRLLKSVVVNANDAVLIAEFNHTDPLNSRIVYVNVAFTRMTGYDQEEALGETPRLLLGPHTDRRQAGQVCDALSERKPIRVEIINYRKDGSEYWVDVNFVPIADDDGRHTHWVAVQREITLRKRAEDLEKDRTRVLELVARNEPLESVLTHLAQMVERQCPQTVCSVFLLQNGILHAVAIPGVPGGHLRPPAPIEAVRMPKPSPDAGLGSSAPVAGSFAVSPAWGDPRQLPHSAELCNGWSVPIYSASGSILGVFAIHYRAPRRPTDAEIDLLGQASRLAAIAIEQRQLTDRLAHQAQHDALTGLPNRALFEAGLQRALAHAGRQGSHLAVLFVDLDRFKQINDSLGHSVGDVLLQQVARRLEGCVRKSDMLARMGGDEFTLLLTELKDQQFVLRVAQKLLDALKAPFRVDSYELFVTASIGISLYPRDGKDAATLQRKADSAMYRAKYQGKNHYQLFLPEITATALESLELENALRKAVENGDLQIRYQPQVDPQGRLAALEALLVWNHPRLGLISPSQFIPVAEQSGLILPLGNWVLRQACRQNAAWRKAGYPVVRMAVNVSAVQFARDKFVDNAARALAESGLEPSLLELELTESVVMRDVEESSRQMQSLRALGVGLAIDDFGTGYSSLSYLRRFPIDTLKIDQSFLRDLETEPNTMPLINAIVALAHSLRLGVIAEGVENDRQLEALRQAGCDRFQGYLFGQPLPPDGVARLLSRREPLLYSPDGAEPRDGPGLSSRPLPATRRSTVAVN